MDSDLCLLIRLLTKATRNFPSRQCRVALRIREEDARTEVPFLDSPKDWERLRKFMPLHWQDMAIVGVERLFDIHTYTKGTP